MIFNIVKTDTHSLDIKCKGRKVVFTKGNLTDFLSRVTFTTSAEPERILEQSIVHNFEGSQVVKT